MHQILSPLKYFWNLDYYFKWHIVFLSIVDDSEWINCLIVSPRASPIFTAIVRVIKEYQIISYCCIFIDGAKEPQVSK